MYPSFNKYTYLNKRLCLKGAEIIALSTELEYRSDFAAVGPTLRY